MDWIAVEDRMPEHLTVVLVDGGVGFWHEREKLWHTITGFDWPGRPIQWEVTHWMPLPKLPTALATSPKTE